MVNVRKGIRIDCFSVFLLILYQLQAPRRRRGFVAHVTRVYIYIIGLASVIYLQYLVQSFRPTLPRSLPFIAHKGPKLGQMFQDIAPTPPHGQSPLPFTPKKKSLLIFFSSIKALPPPLVRSTWRPALATRPVSPRPQARLP